MEHFSYIYSPFLFLWSIICHWLIYSFGYLSSVIWSLATCLTKILFHSVGDHLSFVDYSLSCAKVLVECLWLLEVIWLSRGYWNIHYFSCLFASEPWSTVCSCMCSMTWYIRPKVVELSDHEPSKPCIKINSFSSWVEMSGNH